MSTPLEHDYIGLSEKNPSMEGISVKLSSTSPSSASAAKASFKETELRLGLPGCDSLPERKSGVSVSLFGQELQQQNNNKHHHNLCSVAGAKRGFSDAIDGKWGLSVVTTDHGSEEHLGGKGAAFNPITPAVAQTMKDAAMVTLTPQSSKPVQEKKNPHQVVVVAAAANENSTAAPAAKAQVVGWPPIRSFRKNTMASNSTKNNDEAEGKPGFGCLYVKVSMDGAPYLRKVDLKNYTNYRELSSALEKMFSCFTIGQCNSPGLPGKDGLSESSLRDLLHGSEYVLTYEDKDGDWMLVGDVPWEMFTDSCRRLRIMKGSEAIGLAPRAVEKSRSQN